MKKLVYLFLSVLVASCIGGVVPKPDSAAPKDSDSVPTIVNIVDTTTVEDTTKMALTPQQADSLMFRLTHHYSENFNFLVKADSLTLIPREGDLMIDTCRVYRGDVVAVAAIKIVPSDSIDSVWVKVASNQYNMGWIPEHDLLRGATPDDIISEMLDALSGSRAIWMSALLVLGILAVVVGKKQVRKQQILHFFDEMNSCYPFLFLLLTAIMATLYASVQNFVPEFWQEYYYHPTLNPLVLPPIMAALVVTTWLVIITFIALTDEVYHHFYFIPGVTYLAKLVGVAMFVYLLVSWSTLFYVGYPLVAVLAYHLLRQAWHVIRQDA